MPLMTPKRQRQPATEPANPKRQAVGPPGDDEPSAAVEVPTLSELLKALNAFPDRLALSPREAAKALGVGHDLVYSLMAKDRLRSVRIGSRRLIPKSALIALLEETGS